MLYPEMLASPVVLTNSRGLSAETIAEHILAVTLATFRRIPLAVRRQAARQWAQNEVGGPGNRAIRGSHVLIVGLGAIGTAAAGKLAALGARVTGIRRRTGVPSPVSVAEVATPDRLHEWLPSAEDRAFVASLMGRVVEPGKFAHWIAPPVMGINRQPIDFEYVRFG